MINLSNESLIIKFYSKDYTPIWYLQECSGKALHRFRQLPNSSHKDLWFFHYVRCHICTYSQNWSLISIPSVWRPLPWAFWNQDAHLSSHSRVKDWHEILLQSFYWSVILRIWFSASSQDQEIIFRELKSFLDGFFISERHICSKGRCWGYLYLSTVRSLWPPLFPLIHRGKSYFRAKVQNLWRSICCPSDIWI